jgi:hypothetical protein
MRELVLQALRRNLALAEQRGDLAWAERIRAKLAPEAVDESEPVVEELAPPEPVEDTEPPEPKKKGRTTRRKKPDTQDETREE